MALASAPQEDFSVGIYRGRKAPQSALYDAVNVLINDEGLPIRRGGSAYYSSANAGSNILAVYDTFLQGGQRTVGIAGDAVYVLNGTSPVTILSLGGVFIATSGRGVGIGGILAVPTQFGIGMYGGSLKSAYYSTGTFAATNGSDTITGTGTSWLANVDAGMIISKSSSGQYAVVKTVVDDTTITLRDPWPFPTITGATYTIGSIMLGLPTSSDAHVAAVGSTPRLVVTGGNKAFFTERGPVLELKYSENFIELPTSAIITGIAPMGTGCVLFTTDGVWAVSNMDLDPVDAYGNIQWAQERVDGNLILWGDPGIVPYAGSLIVPGIDDVYSFTLGGGPIPLTGMRGEAADAGIRGLYRSYVKAGYQPGLATVYRGHYLLPVINGSTLIDVLVCRLDRGAAWTRWSGHAAGYSYALRTSLTARAPQLLGVAGQRITDLSGCFTPSSSNATDADGATSDCVITTRDFSTGGNQQGFVQRARLRYELTDDGNGATPAPTVALAYSSDADAGSFTTLTEKGQEGGAAGWGVSDGSKYQWANVGKRRERIRFRVTVTGACASFVLRSIELLLRPTGKQ